MAVRQEEDGIVGARVAVHGDRVERAVDHALPERPQGAGLRYRIRREDAQQRGHVGMDHPGPFRHAADRNRPPGRFDTHRAVLGPGVRRHDRASSVDAAVRRELAGSLAQSPFHFIHRERHTNHAGREHERRARWQAGCLFGAMRHRTRGLEPRGAGASVRDAGIHCDGAHAPRLLAEQRGVVDDGCGAQRTLGEDPGRCAARPADEQRHVECAARFQTGVRSRGGQTAGRCRRTAVYRGNCGRHGRLCNSAPFLIIAQPSRGDSFDVGPVPQFRRIRRTCASALQRRSIRRRHRYPARRPGVVPPRRRAACRDGLRPARARGVCLGEARIYLANLLYDRGEYEAALFHLERTGPEEHYDALAIWRLVELKKSVYRLPDDDPELVPWNARLNELTGDAAPEDILLAEIEAMTPDGQIRDPRQLELFGTLLTELQGMKNKGFEVHRVSTVSGATYVGTWEEIVRQMKDDAAEWVAGSLEEYMEASARRWRKQTGVAIPPRIRSRPRLRNTPPTASRMKNAAYGANEFTRSPLEHGHREERPQIVVRHAQPGGQEPHDRP